MKNDDGLEKTIAELRDFRKDQKNLDREAIRCADKILAWLEELAARRKQDGSQTRHAEERNANSPGIHRLIPLR